LISFGSHSLAPFHSREFNQIAKTEIEMLFRPGYMDDMMRYYDDPNPSGVHGSDGRPLG